MENNGFIFYPSFYEALEGLPDEAYLRLTKCIISYGITGEQTDLAGYERNIFATIKAQIDANTRKMGGGKKGGSSTSEAKAAAARENGKRGGRPKDENPTAFDENPSCIGLETQAETQGASVNNPNNNNTNNNTNENDNNKDNDQAGVPPEENLDKLSPSQTFIAFWQKNCDVFNLMARLEQPKEWEGFWNKCGYSPREVEAALNNFCDAVRKGIIEERYVPATPDRFVMKGWLQKSRNPFRPKAASPPPKKGPDWGGAVDMGKPVKAKSFFEGGDK